MMTLGEKIKTLRKKRYTQEELADRLGIHVNTLVRWERGDRMPTADKLKELANILGTTSDYLLSETDTHAPNSESVSASAETPIPYTQEQINKGMLVYTLSNGERIELPPIKESYDFLRDIALKTASAGALA